MAVTVTIDGRTVEVEAGTNLVDAAMKAGIQVPHYCYHPRLSIVGQCRMCLIKIEGMGKLQTACTTQVMKDGMVVSVDDDDVREAQEGMMEFLLINHPLDCPICDQAGECGLQDYSFKHGQAFSRFAFEDKRTYPGKERIPLGPTVLLNMNRCIQCTRCIRFTEEISQTGELGFFQRGSRAEIGVFPDRVLDNDLSTCVVDVCPVGALTSTKFRFAERVWYLDKKPSICTGCDAGCNVTLEHRNGQIRRYKPRFNDFVNDYWMCDFGRTTFERYSGERLTAPERHDGNGGREVINWKQALANVHHALSQAGAMSQVGILARGSLTTEEAFLLAEVANRLKTPHRGVVSENSVERRIPNTHGGIVGRESTPNRRGGELAGLLPLKDGFGAAELIAGEISERNSTLFVYDEASESLLHSQDVVDKLRRAETLIVIGWGRTPLTDVADFVLPIATHAESDGTFVNASNRLQRFEKAFPAPAGIRSGISVLSELLHRFDGSFTETETAGVFDRMTEALPALAGLSFARLPADGVELPGDA